MRFLDPRYEARHEFVDGPLDTEMISPPKRDNGELADRLYMGKHAVPGHWTGLRFKPDEGAVVIAYYQLKPDPDSSLKSKYIWTQA